MQLSLAPDEDERKSSVNERVDPVIECEVSCLVDVRSIRILRMSL